MQRVLGRRARVVWTDNRTVYLSVRRGGAPDEAVVRLHRSFESAPEDVWGALVDYLSTGKSALLGAARAYFEEWIRSRPLLGAVRRDVGRRKEPAGCHHDLGEIFGRVSREAVFEGLPLAEVSWSSRRAVGRRTVRLGSYQPRGRGCGKALVRVHPVLDSAKVPRLVVEHVVRHELLHHLLHVTRGPAEGRRHRGAFRRLERLHQRWGEAEEWIRAELPRILRGAAGRKEAS